MQEDKSFFTNLKEILIKQLRGEAVKLALKKILGSSYAGGFKAWLVTLIVKELYDELGEPILRAGLNYVGYTYDKIHGEVLIKKLREAKDETEYDRRLDDILN